MKKIINQFSFAPEDFPAEIVDSTRIVDTTGYLPLEFEISRYIQSGETLNAYRDNLSRGLGFGSDDGSEPDIAFSDRRNVDIVDATEELISVVEKARERSQVKESSTPKPSEAKELDSGNEGNSSGVEN